MFPTDLSDFSAEYRSFRREIFRFITNDEHKEGRCRLQTHQSSIQSPGGLRRLKGHATGRPWRPNPTATASGSGSGMRSARGRSGSVPGRDIPIGCGSSRARTNHPDADRGLPPTRPRAWRQVAPGPRRSSRAISVDSVILFSSTVTAPGRWPRQAAASPRREPWLIQRHGSRTPAHVRRDLAENARASVGWARLKYAVVRPSSSSNSKVAGNSPDGPSSPRASCQWARTAPA
jgi:hypothetical protein